MAKYWILLNSGEYQFISAKNKTEARMKSNNLLKIAKKKKKIPRYIKIKRIRELV